MSIDDRVRTTFQTIFSRSFFPIPLCRHLLSHLNHNEERRGSTCREDKYSTRYTNKKLRVVHFNFKEYVNLLLHISQFYLRLLYFFLYISKSIDDRILVLIGRPRSGKTMITAINYTRWIYHGLQTLPFSLGVGEQLPLSEHSDGGGVMIEDVL